MTTLKPPNSERSFSCVGKGVAFENRIAEAFREQGYIVRTRKNHIDVFAVKHDSHAYVVECKNYRLCRAQQMGARRQLTKNLKHAIDLLREIRLHVDPRYIIPVLVAQGFAYQSRGILQYTPEEFLDHIAGRHLKTVQFGECPDERISASSVCSGGGFGDSVELIGEIS